MTTVTITRRYLIFHNQKGEHNEQRINPTYSLHANENCHNDQAIAARYYGGSGHGNTGLSSLSSAQQSSPQHSGRRYHVGVSVQVAINYKINGYF
jgi:hypothetical protein